MLRLGRICVRSSVRVCMNQFTQMLENREERLSVIGAALYVVAASAAFFVLVLAGGHPDLWPQWPEFLVIVLIGMIAGYARWTVAAATLWIILHALTALSGVGGEFTLESVPWWAVTSCLVLGVALLGAVPRILIRSTGR
ncbi:MAG: hypothetical protein NVS2B16_16850 [Chloroflexota bacterium]